MLKHIVIIFIYMCMPLSLDMYGMHTIFFAWMLQRHTNEMNTRHFRNSVKWSLLTVTETVATRYNVYNIHIEHSVWNAIQ